MKEHAATVDPAETPESLVAAAVRLKAKIAADEAELAGIEQRLIAHGAGKYGTDVVLTVVAAREGFDGTVYYELASEDEEEAKRLAGEDFAKLFDRSVTFSPCKGFADVVPKLLTPAKARDIVALCKRMTKGGSSRKAYVQYPKK